MKKPRIYLDTSMINFLFADNALHVAYATVFQMDVLLSWNFKHLANLRREARFAAVNHAEGYWRNPRIVAPMELEDDDEE